MLWLTLELTNTIIRTLIEKEIDFAKGHRNPERQNGLDRQSRTRTSFFRRYGG
jgi:hypothetical protein